MATTKKARLLEQFAPLIGGIDSDGNEHKLSRKPSEVEGKQRQHLFWVKNVELENSYGTFVLGDIAKSKILEDKYEVEYMGLNRNSSKNKKVQKKLLEQQVDLIKGERAKNERMGIFNEDSYYDAKLKAAQDELKEQFKALEES